MKHHSSVFILFLLASSWCVLWGSVVITTVQTGGLSTVPVNERTPRFLETRPSKEIGIKSDDVGIPPPCSLSVVGCEDEDFITPGGDLSVMAPTTDKPVTLKYDLTRTAGTGVIGKTVLSNVQITAYVTAYSRESSCHYPKGKACLMASGKDVYEGAAACPYSLKLGQEVRVSGRTFKCEDRYAKRLDTIRGLPTIDIFMNSNADAIKWGKKKMEITVL